MVNLVVSLSVCVCKLVKVRFDTKYEREYAVCRQNAVRPHFSNVFLGTEVVDAPSARAALKLAYTPLDIAGSLPLFAVLVPASAGACGFCPSKCGRGPHDPKRTSADYLGIFFLKFFFFSFVSRAWNIFESLEYNEYFENFGILGIL